MLRTLAIYLEYINFSASSDSTVPFNWYDWKNLGENIDFIIKMDKASKPNCEFLINRYHPRSKLKYYEVQYGQPIIRENRNLALNIYEYSDEDLIREQSESQLEREQYCIKKDSNVLGFEIKNFFTDCMPEVLSIQSSAYLFQGGNSPLSITIVNSRLHKSKQFTVEHSDHPILSKPNILFNYLQNEKGGDFDIDIAEKFDQIFSDHGDNDKKLPKLSNYLKRFVTNTSYQEEDYEALGVIDAHKMNFRESLEFVSTQKATTTEFKYFKEPKKLQLYKKLDNPGYTTHIDTRFFNYPILTMHDRLPILHGLVKAWFEFLEYSTDFSSWIAHGSLYAYMYNGAQFPWDLDHDIQMPIDDLIRLSVKYNQSLIVTNSGSVCFLDISPFILKGRHFSGGFHNHIDARFIDVTTGLYIDITGVGFSGDIYEDEPHANVRLSLEFGKNILDGGNDIYEFNMQNGIVNCRNRHFAKIDDLLPTRRANFEGVTVNIPNKPVNLLRDEYRIISFLYGPGLQYKGYNFIPELRSWLKYDWIKGKLGISEGKRLGELSFIDDLLPFFHKSSEFFKGHEDELIHLLNLQRVAINRFEVIGIEQLWSDDVEKDQYNGYTEEIMKKKLELSDVLSNKDLKNPMYKSSSLIDVIYHQKWEEDLKNFKLTSPDFKTLNEFWYSKNIYLTSLKAVVDQLKFDVINDYIFHKYLVNEYKVIKGDYDYLDQIKHNNEEEEEEDDSGGIYLQNKQSLRDFVRPIFVMELSKNDGSPEKKRPKPFIKDRLYLEL
ncbi:uncharacterized protein SCODWIG_00089 [Saccharomycodes ludwigii]|uniref:LicD/FKTN/FKRP nucleotidyltransferase domain-containing protein n=1 Tax=Saccharomycodes ludwigii TaxID=36035 RepID=A0A376B0X5_9ASCO|nr:uncharacterized protein SCODWIG_00089 [Saccharomycodes ludwigii]